MIGRSAVFLNDTVTVCLLTQVCSDCLNIICGVACCVKRAIVSFYFHCHCISALLVALLHQWQWVWFHFDIRFVVYLLIFFILQFCFYSLITWLSSIR